MKSSNHSPIERNNSTIPSSSSSTDEKTFVSGTKVSQSVTKLAEPTKTMPLDRTNDTVYMATTNVVKAIMTLSQGVEKANAVEYLDLVKNVGIELRNLLGSVDTLSVVFPPQAHK